MTDLITQRLDALAQTSPELRDAAQFYKAILPLLRDADMPAASLALTADEARVKLQNGLPLLTDVELEIDPSAVCNLMMRLLSAIEQIRADTSAPKKGLRFLRGKPNANVLYAHARAGDDRTLRAAAAKQIRLALEQNKIAIDVLLPRVAAGDRAFVATAAARNQLDADLLWTVLQYALKPALRQWAKQLAPLARGVEWKQGTCYVCGALAILGEFQSSEQAKHLRCGQCGADWQAERIRCVFCGNTDHNTLGYLYAEPERAKMRVEICDQCGGYLKIISAFDPTPVDLLPIEDLATLHLDYIAQERGYAHVAV